MRITVFSLVMILLLATTVLAGGKSSIVGQVRIPGGEPLAGAEITIIGEATYTNRVAVTDDKGVYYITNLPADEYIIQAIARPSGIYKPGSQNVVLENNTEKEVIIELEKR